MSGTPAPSKRPARFGVGLKPAHYPAIAAGVTRVDWFEAISENYMVGNGRPLRQLEKIRRDHPIGLHGVSMSLGSASGVPDAYLRELDRLVRRIQPMHVSDHLCFSGQGGHYSHDLLPLPMNEEAAALAAANIGRVQDALQRQILVENISTYVRTRADTLSEAEFVKLVIEQADCFLLLDVNNIVVNAHNHGLDAAAYLEALPIRRVKEIHVAGHSVIDDFLFDDHVGPTPDGVWALYLQAVNRFGPVDTLIEWDSEVPAFEVLAAEAEKARAIALKGSTL